MKKTIISTLLCVFVATSGSAQEVSKEHWISAMRTALPAHFCQEAQYFRQCFNIAATECEKVAASSTRICLNELNAQIPDVLIQPDDGAIWGRKVGSCAGTAYEVALIKKRISSDRCNDVSNWQ